jgi:hypothetical protein
MTLKCVFICNELDVDILLALKAAIEKDSRFDLTVISSERTETAWSRGISESQIQSNLLESKVQSIRGSEASLENYRGCIFATSSPYDDYLPSKFSSLEIIRYGTLININYGIGLFNWHGSETYLKENPFHNRSIRIYREKKLRGMPRKNVGIGYLKLASYPEFFKSITEDSIKKTRSDVKIAWKPRWTLGSDSTLFEFLPEFSTMLVNHENYFLTLIEHPLLRSKLHEKNRYKEFLKWEEVMSGTGRYQVARGKEALPAAFSSNIFCSDLSSTTFEFCLTGKPNVVLNQQENLNRHSKKMLSVSYNITDPQSLATEVSRILENDYRYHKRNNFRKKWLREIPHSGQLLLDDLFWAHRMD